MNIEIQQQFEIWARSQCMQLKKDGVVTTYAYERTDLAWQAWQASREALVIELPPLSGMNSSFVADGIQKTREHNRYNAAVKDCRKAIEAAGLKVKP